MAEGHCGLPAPDSAIRYGEGRSPVVFCSRSEEVVWEGGRLFIYEAVVLYDSYKAGYGWTDGWMDGIDYRGGFWVVRVPAICRANNFLISAILCPLRLLLDFVGFPWILSPFHSFFSLSLWGSYILPSLCPTIRSFIREQSTSLSPVRNHILIRH